MTLRVFLVAWILLGVLLIGCKKNTVTPVDNSEVNPLPPIPPIVTSNEEIFTSLENDSSDTYFLYNQGSNTKYKEHKYQGCPSIGIFNNIYYTAWISGGLGEQLGNYITVASSNDEGATWNRNEFIITSNRDTLRHIDPMFWNDRSGALHLSWTKSIGMWDGGLGGVWHVKLKKTTSNNIIITKPTKLFNGTLNVKPTTLLNDSSTFIFPVSGWNVPNPWNGYPIVPTSAVDNGPLVYISNNNGLKGINDPIRIAKIYDTLKDRNFDEHMIVDLGNNTFQCLMRTEKGVFTSKSTDAGKTWTTPAKFTAVGITCPTRIFFGRLKSGNLLIVLNNSDVRNNLKAFLSTDNGVSWPYSILIDNRLNSSYPDVTQNSRGDICMIYDRDRYNAQEMVFKKFTENIIINNLTSQIITSVISDKDH
jgi:hypothetical protein